MSSNFIIHWKWILSIAIKLLKNKIQIQYLYKFTHKLSYLLKSVPWVSIHIFFGPAKNSAYPEMYAFVSFLNI